jgi:hypothetical protein
MANGRIAAQALVEFDPRVADHVLRLVALELGIDEQEPQRLQARLANLTASDGAGKSTQEWKVDFAQLERLRSLALALAEALSGPERRDP